MDGIILSNYEIHHLNPIERRQTTNVVGCIEETENEIGKFWEIFYVS